MRIDNTRDGRLVYVCGASRSGKSAWVKRQVEKSRRLLIWDIEDEYGDLPGIKSLSSQKELLQMLKTSGLAGPGRFAFVPLDPKQFNWWASAAFAWGNCAAVAEELADVTNPGKAPPGWGTLIRRGAKRGIEIIGITQRPSEADKTLLGNANIKHCCRLERAGDRSYMAKELDCPIEDINGLGTRVKGRFKYLDYVEKVNGELKRGYMKFPYNGK